MTKYFVKLHPGARVARIAISMLAIAAWFIASDHCAIASVTAQHLAVSPAHQHCPGHPTPAREGSHGDGLMCCKSLLAISVAPAKTLVGYDLGSFTPKDYFTTEFAFPTTDRDVPHLELDTGPSESRSFAESVLQRSIFAHAPPALA
ncbi:MAG: hypothetical protein ABJB22_01955 [Verrucomicrobiota bacterium]